MTRWTLRKYYTLCNIIFPQLTLDSNFAKDFGIDSLDHVEIVMEMEQEFNFEIPDVDSERFHTPRDIVRYICDKYDLYE
ncbi:unnamed protein product [Calicophoron daubneyi]|uniref:Acyl carrier protein n=1 Tax=Calicophoron daubneyi TaxID=300641 RepID=A0AAV2T7H3_CALDB